jgi:hypothetical protein
VAAPLPVALLVRAYPGRRLAAGGGPTAEAVPETWLAAASLLRLLVTAAAFAKVTVLITLAVILLVRAPRAPAGTRTSVRVDSLGLFSAGFSQFPLALGFKLGTPGAPMPRAGLFPKPSCLSAAPTLATSPHCRHEKQDQQQQSSRDDDDYQSSVHPSSSEWVLAQIPLSGTQKRCGRTPARLPVATRRSQYDRSRARRTLGSKETKRVVGSSKTSP